MRPVFWLVCGAVTVVLIVLVGFGHSSIRWGAVLGLVLWPVAEATFISATKPLSPQDVARLAQKRRSRRIRQHLTPSPRVWRPDPGFKSALDREGRWYPINLELSQVPSYGANLLKYKKHEWIAIFLVSGRQAVALWTNKGPDRTQVWAAVPLSEVAGMASRFGAEAVLVLHNHPASDPHHYRYNAPSQRDLTSAASCAEELNQRGLSLIEYVCERGVAYVYLMALAESLFPVAHIQREVAAQNGRGRWGNARLRLELLRL